MYVKSTVPVLAVTGIPVALLAGTAVALIVSGVLLVLLSAGVFAKRRRLRTLGAFSESAEPASRDSWVSPRLPWPVVLGSLTGGWAVAPVVPSGSLLGALGERFHRLRGGVFGCLGGRWPARGGSTVGGGSTAGGYRLSGGCGDAGCSPVVAVRGAPSDPRREPQREPFPAAASRGDNAADRGQLTS